LPGGWNAPVPGFGDPDAWLAICGLAPGLQGANRTGRPFTGDYAGVLLYETLIKFGFARGRYDARPDDGLELVDCMITNAVRCAPPANKPTPAERDACRPFLERELALLSEARVYLALGAFGYEALAAAVGLRPRPRFGHGVEAALPDGRILLCSFHPSQQNTFTGRLTEAMLDSVIARAKELASSSRLGAASDQRGQLSRGVEHGDRGEEGAERDP
jgi:uracil-DNA glycosylase family 4